MDRIMELGKYQKAWIKSLRENHEKQMKGSLGKGTPENYKACCLGEGLLTICRLENLPFPFFEDEIFDGVEDKSTGTLINSYDKLGLVCNTGSFLNDFKLSAKGCMSTFYCESLTSANDNGYSWLEIADLMESHPENFFVKSK